MPSARRKRLILNGFTMSAVGHISPGLWRHPDDHAYRYRSLKYWTDLAQLLESGGFDALFIADVLGPIEVYQGKTDAALRNATQMPVSDPLLAVSAMAAATRHLGFGVTVSTSYAQPYLLARTFSTLDQLTDGRIAWNVVTSMIDSAARNLGLSEQFDHDERYDRAQEFLDVTYKLWEGSWEDEAVLRDRAAGVYTDPAKVHRIDHHGKYYDVVGPHLCEPTPQRTPVIFQAGASARGQEFAARNAELVFLGGRDAREIGRSVTQIKRRAAAAGRDPEAIKFITSVTVITGPDDATAQSKHADYVGYSSTEGALALFSAFTGHDWSGHDLDEVVQRTETNASQSTLASGRGQTLRDIVDTMALGGLHPTIIGGPHRVADQLEALAEEADLDGFNLAHVVSPGSFEDFIEFVVPELRRRGRLPNNYLPGTLREKLSETASPAIRDDHPASAYRIGARATARA
ncbi:LLM class flavin-dependent oxidoreductase [Mycobacterium aquaticum]|uniref:5,10-methylene tetrahydromethanopterin reductase n=1 Tax=Mycobacterium aquaticum TaxID=1927124 RepID=A0A1X0BAN8_9MYCO|nr:LLM class flavin-dependent oxidoreductase [Mycobacterium aquaticum]ORA39269.1 5,10-methylene tetrahydromethanopterin reductase [Mycobacterium aquaticum]